MFVYITIQYDENNKKESCDYKKTKQQSGGEILQKVVVDFNVEITINFNYIKINKNKIYQNTRIKNAINTH